MSGFRQSRCLKTMEIYYQPEDITVHTMESAGWTKTTASNIMQWCRRQINILMKTLL